MVYVLIALGGCALGSLVAWLLTQRSAAAALAVLREERARLQSRLEERDLQLVDRQNDLQRILAECDSLRERLATSESQAGRLQADLDNERRSGDEKVRLLQQAEQKLRETFQALSAEALQRNNQSFLDLARTHLETFQKQAQGDLSTRQKAIDELVKPLRESLQKVDQNLQQSERDRIRAYATLTEQVQAMTKAQQSLQSETGNLVRALRRPQVRGSWGEIQLRKVVELAGMVGYCDFVEQNSLTTDSGKLRPDMIVRLPAGKQVVVDAKAPMEAYLQAVEARSDEERDEALQNHARQVRDKIRQLSSKEYWSQVEGTPEFVVMFLPGEALFNAALGADRTLIDFGIANRVIPASPTTLIALLWSVAFGWKQEQIAESAREVHALGRELHERLATLVTHWNKLRRHLENAVQTYNDATGSFESRALVSARRLSELGAGSSKEIPDTEQVALTPRMLQLPEAAEETLQP